MTISSQIRQDFSKHWYIYHRFVKFSPVDSDLLKIGIPKQEPKTVTYRSYRNFDENVFRHDLRNELYKDISISSEKFEKIFIEFFEKHAPSRTRKVRANDKRFVTQALRKTMMATSQMEKYNRVPSKQNKVKYKMQKKYTKRLCK